MLDETVTKAVVPRTERKETGARHQQGTNNQEATVHQINDFVCFLLFIVSSTPFPQIVLVRLVTDTFVVWFEGAHQECFIDIDASVSARFVTKQQQQNKFSKSFFDG